MKPHYKYAEVPQFSISTPSFSITSFFEDILTTSSGSAKWQIQCQLPPLSFKISLKDASFHISINSLGLYLSPECFLNFLSNLYIPPWLEKNFKFMVFSFLENVLNLGIFNHALLSPVKTLPRILLEIWKWLGTSGYLYLVCFVFFSNMMAYHMNLSYCMVLFLISLFCNHDNLWLKLH